MAATIHLKIITPERVLFDDQIQEISLPTKEGEISVLPNHIPLICLLRAGELRIKTTAKEVPLVVSGGFAEITGKKILILADSAERIEEIDEKRAEEARERAAEQLKTVKLDSEEYAYLAAKVEKELARLRVKRKHHRDYGKTTPSQ